jgi:hypothetical protein
MSEDQLESEEEARSELRENLEACLEAGSMKAFNKSFKDLSAMLESAGTKLSSEEMASLIVLGASLIRESKVKAKS